MKTTVIIVSSLLYASLCVASERHEADEALEKTLRSTLDAKHVHVHVHEGVVTLEGRVRTDADRQSIDSLVRSTPGVGAVKDELKVALSSPGAAGAVVTYPATVTTSIPIYTQPPPEVQVTPPVPVVSVPAPVIVPDYPRLKIQASTTDDLPVANGIARQLQIDDVPTAGLQDVTISVRNGIVVLKGAVESHEDRDVLIAATQHTGGMRAIYDQLQITEGRPTTP